MALNGKMAPVGANPMRAYRTPKLTRYGSVRNLTGGSCGLDFDGFFGNANDGNPFGIGC